MTTANGRTSDHPIDEHFLKRWSPRAFDNASIPHAELLRLFEAARWAPSSYNSQPWRFLYAHRNTPGWARFVDLLNPFNRSWAEHASVLVLLLSSKMMTPPGGSPVHSHSHSLDAGAAWSHLALQAATLGLHAHAMVGFDMDGARTEFGIPEDYHLECMIALGRQGDPAVLSESLRAREVPNDRRPLSELIAEGGFADLGRGAGA